VPKAAVSNRSKGSPYSIQNALLPFFTTATRHPLLLKSEEKREPVSDIDTGVVDSLKVLNPDGLIRITSSCLAGANSRFPNSCERCTMASWLQC
jgi:hypothetical protein